MPPNARQAGQFLFANSCRTPQTFAVTTRPPADWLSIEPPRIDVNAAQPFAVHVKLSTFETRRLGAYQSTLVVICSSCSASNPPCFETAKEIPITLTVANIKKPGEFEITAAPPDPARTETPKGEAVKLPISETPPPKPTGKRTQLIPVASGLLVVIAGGAILAARGRRSPRVAPGADPEEPAETQRHTVRW